MSESSPRTGAEPGSAEAAERSLRTLMGRWTAGHATIAALAAIAVGSGVARWIGPMELSYGPYVGPAVGLAIGAFGALRLAPAIQLYRLDGTYYTGFIRFAEWARGRGMIGATLGFIGLVVSSVQLALTPDVSRGLAVVLAAGLTVVGGGYAAYCGRTLRVLQDPSIKRMLVERARRS